MLKRSEKQSVEHKKYIKYVNFDLSTEELKKHFGNNTAKAYELIKSFFGKKDFEHRQYSSYISKKPIDEYDFSQILETFARTHIWLKDCLQSFDILNVENEQKIDGAEQIRNTAQETEQRQLTKLETLTQKLDREVKYYNEHQNSLYQDAKIRSQNTIIALCNELMQNGVTIDNKNVKVLQAIIIERNGGKAL